MVHFAIGERSLFEKWFWSGAFRPYIIDRSFSANLLVNKLFAIRHYLSKYLMLLAKYSVLLLTS